jgi:hypothetical protein
MGTTAAAVDVTCVDAVGVVAFGGFRPALKCEDFVDNGSFWRPWCFTVNSQVMCMGATGQGTCTDTATGIELTMTASVAYPLRFNNNVDTCMNYNPDPGALTNLANAVGYTSYTVNRSQPGNSCGLSWVDANGNYATGPGNGALAEIYDISFFGSD